MELQERPGMTAGYHTVAVLNEAHQVFLVQDQNTRKVYVKKLMEVYNPAVYQCLRQHPVPGVPRILDCFEEQGRMTVIEEYISGDSLEEKLQREHFTRKTVVAWMTELCLILEQLHQLTPPVIHRDIKPSNVMITGGDHVVLLDFNAAKQYHGAAAADTVLLGTQGYAAPEQYGFGASTPQTDIYAVGVLLRELLERTTEADGRLTQIADRCTKLSPEQRYQTVADLRMALAETEQSDAQRREGRRTAAEKSFLPPGFRTRTPWKMAVAGVVYLVVFWMSLTLQTRNMTGGAVWLERLACLSMGLAIIAGTCNYRGIQRFVPLCRSRSWFLRGLGILLLDFVMAAALFMLMVILENLVFHV